MHMHAYTGHAPDAQVRVARRHLLPLEELVGELGGKRPRLRAASVEQLQRDGLGGGAEQLFLILVPILFLVVLLVPQALLLLLLGPLVCCTVIGARARGYIGVK